MNYLGRNYRYFLEIAAKGSITEASRSLRIGQPTLSLAMEQLEHEVGVPLFEKRGRNKVLSPAGVAFSESLREGAKRLAEGCSSALTHHDQKPIRFGVVTHYALKRILPALGEIERKFGAIHAHFGYSLPIFEQVRAGHLDFGLITWTREPKWPNRVFLREDPHAVVGLKGKFDHIAKAKNMAELSHERWIWHRKPQNFVNDYLKPGDQGIVVDGYEVLKSLLFSGWGIAAVQLDFFDPHELRRLVRSQVSVDPQIGLYLVYGSELSQRGDKLVTFIKDLVLTK